MGGYPCKDLSPLTTTPGSVVDPNCQSGKGYLGVEGYIERHRPNMVLLENVRALFSKRKKEKGKTPFLILHSVLLGFVNQWWGNCLL